MPGPHRRSRKGCTACRVVRVKCDERRPACTRCKQNDLECAYVTTFKWIDEPKRRLSTKYTTSCSSQTSKLQQQSSSRVDRSLDSPGLLTASKDIHLLYHWLKFFDGVSFFSNLKEYDDMRVEYLKLLISNQTSSVLLPAVLYNAATHLHTQGILTQAEHCQRKTAALSKLIDSMSISKKKTGEAPTTQVSFAFSDGSIAASAMMASGEIIQGAPWSVVTTYLRGMNSQLLGRSKAGLTTDTPPDNLLYCLALRMYCFFSAMCCIPCARPPVADEKFWEKYLLPNIEIDKPDIIMGYCPRVFMLIGSCSAIIHDLYSGVVGLGTFIEVRGNLIVALEQACDNLNAQNEFESDVQGNNPDAPSVTDLIACRSAAIAHSLATRIFLLRATEPLETTGAIQGLVSQLQLSVRSVPATTNAMIVMLWPLFVLGCEASADVQERERVIARMGCMLTKGHILNIERCIEALRDLIWRIYDDMDALDLDWRTGAKGGLATRYHFQHVGWVRFCWDNNINLCLA